MKHYVVRKNFSAYLDGELHHQKSQEIEVHLNSCNSCQREFQQIRKGKSLTAYFEKPQWQETERLWENIQRRKPLTSEKINVRNVEMKRLHLFQKLIHPKPAFAISVLAILFVANLFVNLKREKLQYQQARIDWTPSYVFDYGLYLDSLIGGMPPWEFERRYESQRTSYEKAASQIPFQLASFTRMPETFQLEEVRLLKNACCRSVQFVCSKNSMPIVIFQQPKGHPVTFGKYPLESMRLNGRFCHKVKAGPWIALIWQGQDSEFVAIGEMSESDMASIIHVVTQK